MAAKIKGTHVCPKCRREWWGLGTCPFCDESLKLKRQRIDREARAFSTAGCGWDWTDGTLRLVLPMGPSANNYWRTYQRNGKIMTAPSLDAKAYRVAITNIAITLRWTPFAPNARLRVHHKFYPPDKRRRDSDNYLKPLWDALTHAGVWADDSQVGPHATDDWGPVRAGGQVEVTISELRGPGVWVWTEEA
jgi:crossover junction endodeoxyribonuclease RusA